ncbi:hypothetical protein OAO43_02390 [Candidatus Pelagibacter ubique]|jgi:hypothetical protein|nr:hypothetical protein [Candidatus Pelagibacter ubique]
MKNKISRYGNVMALKEYILSGEKISRIEALVLFGVQDLNRELLRMKKSGFILKNTKTTMTKIIIRLNKFSICKPPKDLPTNEIIMNEYWLSK